MPSLKQYKTYEKHLGYKLSSGDMLSLTYSPSHFTQDIQRKIDAEGGMSDPDFLMAVKMDWDFTDEEGKKVPVTKQVLEEEISLIDRAGMVEAIFKDLFPNAGKALNDSGSAPSRATAKVPTPN